MHERQLNDELLEPAEFRLDHQRLVQALNSDPRFNGDGRFRITDAMLVGRSATVADELRVDVAVLHLQTNQALAISFSFASAALAPYLEPVTE